MVNYRGVKLNEATCRSQPLIIAEITQTYDLLKFAVARSNVPFINYSEADRKTANVQMARAVGVVFGLSILFTIV